MAAPFFRTFPSEADLLLVDPNPIRWKAHDDEGREWHERVSYTKKVTGFIPTWREHSSTPLEDAITVGYFLLFMEALEQEHYIHRERRTRDNTLCYRLRVVHHTAAFWIQDRKEHSKSLRLV